MNKPKGKLIVIDGIDGSGKATQTKLLCEKLENYGLPAKSMDFPQYEKNFFGQMVRQYLDGKFGKATDVNPRLASVLYAADRWESSTTIKKWLESGDTVVLDRYYTSNLIHQSTKLQEKELDIFTDWINKMELEIFNIPKPDVVLFLHLKPEIAIELITKRGSGHDGHENIEHLKLAEQRCLYLSEKLNWTKIECWQDNQILPIETVSQKIWQIIEPLIDTGQ